MALLFTTDSDVINISDIFILDLIDINSGAIVIKNFGLFFLTHDFLYRFFLLLGKHCGLFLLLPHDDLSLLLLLFGVLLWLLVLLSGLNFLYLFIFLFAFTLVIS